MQDEMKILMEFQKNAIASDKFRNEFGGKFVAVLEQKVVDADTNFNALLSRISNILSKKELFVGYLQGKNEGFAL